MISNTLIVCRQAITRPVSAARWRRGQSAIRRGIQRALLSLHRAQLQRLIQMTNEDLAQIDAEMAALPTERVDTERELFRLQQRLAELNG